MNLVSLELENYRQFQGLHTFAPGEQAMVAVIGRNGAGKTTLFEAIEWCLYNPTTIKSAELQSRVGVGRPRVKVVLEDPQSGERFEVERQWKGYSTVAEIYRSSQPDTPVVQGTRQVTDFVTKNLLGLSHKAFVATFFTRQKELSFFGSSSPLERRREVGKLLGLETIRMAQEAIGQKRLQKQTEAVSKQSHYDEESASTDFAGQKAQHEQAIRERERALSEADTVMKGAALDYEQARTALTIEQKRSEKHGSLSLEASRLQGAINACAAQISAAMTNLEEIERAEAELSRLGPIAAEEPACRDRVEAHEREQRRADAIQDLTRQTIQIEETRLRIMDSVADAERIIDGQTEQLHAIAETRQPYGETEIVLLINRAKSVDTESLQKLADDLLASFRQNGHSEECSSTLQKFCDAVADLERQRDDLLKQGDFATAIAEAEAERGRLQDEATAARIGAINARELRGPLAELRDRLAQGDFGDQCPTCGRPFAADDLDRYLETLNTQIAQLDSLIAQHTGVQQRAEREAKAAAERENEARSLATELERLETRIASSKPHIEEAEAKLRSAQEQLVAMLTALQREHPPTNDEITTIQERVTISQRVAAQVPMLERLHAELERTTITWTAVSDQLEALGESDYDAETHRKDREALELAQQAAAKIVVLAQRVANRPEVESAIELARTQTRDTESALAQIQQRLAELSFEPEAMEAKRAEESACLERLNLAVEERHRAESALASERRELDALLAWEKRLERIRDEAIEARREADELKRMYDEFNRFEQFVTQTVTPALADLTSQLVSAVTDGKYDHIQFDDDFGILISDGDEEQYFPLNQFSGGERDVFALCARLALSQLIGGQAQHPLQFVVMDEVFGSLDRERRTNLMDTLQKLVDETGVFKQLFVISHVDDVQASPAFDEIWRVVRAADGTSRLEQMDSTAMPEDM
jgi:DNA repair protein SbcC/Rad50